MAAMETANRDLASFNSGRNSKAAGVSCVVSQQTVDDNDYVGIISSTDITMVLA